MYRFDIVVFNYKRLYCFLNNFIRIQNFSKNNDRITVVSASPSKEEESELIEFCQKNGIPHYRYLRRKNWRLAEYARLDFFSGKVGEIENLNSKYIFQMQEHYLDLEDSCSRWEGQFDNRIKGDVSPDIYFDLNEIELLFENFSLSTLYADRGLPYFYTIDKRKFISPDGGNFIIRTDILPQYKTKFIRLRTTCDNSYSWAVFMEYYWGEIFFEEGSKTFDYCNKKFIESYEASRSFFKIGSEDYFTLRNNYLSTYFYPEYQISPKLSLRNSIKCWVERLKI